jgi:hypothetical protein
MGVCSKKDEKNIKISQKNRVELKNMLFLSKKY